MDPRSERPQSGQGRGWLSGAAAAAVIVTEIAVLAISFGLAYLGLKTNGSFFSEQLASSRRSTWVATTFAALISCGVAVAYLCWYAASTRRFASVVFQLVIIGLVIQAVVSLHSAIPVPAGGIHSPGVGP